VRQYRRWGMALIVNLGQLRVVIKLQNQLPRPPRRTNNLPT
jgi:hypothetical protein